METSRRTVLQLTGAALVVGGVGLTPIGRGLSSKSVSTLAKGNFPVPYRAPLVRQVRLAPDTRSTAADGTLTERYTVTAQAGTASIVPGLMTPVLGYNGLVLGPLINVDRNTKVQLTVRNALPSVHPDHGHALDTSTHLHGSPSLPEYDGYANDLTRPGYRKTYFYDDEERARTLWYHDHAVMRTGENVYSGLAAQYHLHDPVERALLPQGDFDVALTVSDAQFHADGRLMFFDDEHSGLWGDIILVNGRPWPRMQVQRRVYRFRLLNASISRSFRLRLSNGAPVVMVATDGGLMPRSQPVTRWRHGPAERYEFLIDFRGYAAGSRIDLLNDSNPNNVDYDLTGKVMRFEVGDEPVDTSDPSWNRIPVTLETSDVMRLTPAMATKVRRFRLKHDDVTNEWSINDRTWLDVVNSGFKEVMAQPALGAVEIWEFENSSGGWWHPMHIHLVDFKILSRNGRAPFAYERGPKDVVYVGEHETVRLLMKFGPHKGRYMVHCHNLPHEDHDMMGQFRVGLGENDPDPHDPINAAPPVAG